eukprot:11162107-Lingulodinium_polyedra.AAC.1
MSRARNRPGGPPALRSPEFPTGLPSLRGKNASKVADGNALCKFSVQLLRMCARLGIPCIMENPSTSWLWQQPCVLAACALPGARTISVDFCACGTPWRKRTTLLGFNVDLTSLQCLHCRGRGVCSFSRQPHQQLLGQNNCGQFWTKVAEPYPRMLCRALAKIFDDADKQRVLQGLN